MKRLKPCPHCGQALDWDIGAKKMTKAEAIQTIQKMLEVNKSEHRTLMNYQITALEMAVEALSCNKSNKNDLISRSKAIRWVKAECNPYGQPTLDYESGIKVIEHLERMSSEQTERKGEWIGAVEYCKHLEETTGERYQPSGLAGMIYCNQCWTASDRKSNYCRECGSFNRGE